MVKQGSNCRMTFAFLNGRSYSIQKFLLKGNNSVDLWTLDPTSLHLEESQIDNGGNFVDEFDVPIHLHSVPHTGDVTDLLVCNVGE